jgi:glyoxylase-like metal-dependent hydrolase (beta-lactamase superfamily II)
VSAGRDSAALEFSPLSPPAHGESVEFQPGLHWLRLPVPGYLDHINLWLVADRREGWWLVDTGLGIPAVKAAWEPLLARFGLERQLRGILVTHHHPDHYGLAAWLEARCGVAVTMSEGTRSAGRRGVENTGRERIPVFGAHWGVDYPALLATAGVKGGGVANVVAGVPSSGPTLEAGQRHIDTQWTLEVTLHDGHAEGHACLHAREAGLLFAGDELLPNISSNVSLYPQGELADPLGAHLDSLRRLRELPADTWVLPAHGRPFRGAQARLDQLAAEHDQRFGQLLDHAGTPQTAVAFADHLFGHRRLQGMNLLLAMGETLAHLQYLLGTGALVRIEPLADADHDSTGLLSPFGAAVRPRFVRADRLA